MPSPGKREITSNGLVMPAGLGDEFDDETNWRALDQMISGTHPLVKLPRLNAQNQVVDAQGRPVSGAVVWATNPTFAGGADPSGVTPSAAAWNAACQAAAALGVPAFVCAPKGNYLLESTVFVPAGVFIVGEGAGNGAHPLTFTPTASSSFTDGWMFLINSTNGTTAVSNIYAAQYLGGIIGARFNNYTTNLPNIRGAMCFGSAFFQDIRSYRMTCALKRPRNHYIDRFTVIRCHSDQEYNGTTEYQIEIDGTGDTVLIDRCTFPDSGGVTSSGGTNPIKAVRFKNSDSLLSCASAVVRGNVNGDHLFVGVKALRMEVFHSEFGKVTCDRTNVALEDFYVAVPTAHNYTPLVFVGSGFSSAAYFAKLKNIEFNYGWGNFQSPYAFEIKTHHEYHLQIENCYRVSDLSAAAPALLGLRIANASDAAVSSWAAAAHMASAYGILHGYTLEDIRRTVTMDSTYGGAYFASASSSQADWDEAAGTYYYTTQYLLDPVNMIGVNQSNGVQSATISATTDTGIFLTTSVGSSLPSATVIRVYRGTTSGSYDKYIDLPAVMVRSIQDSGSKVCGLPWLSRTAGAVDTLKANANSGKWAVSSATGVRRAEDVFVARTNSNGPFGAYGGRAIIVYTAAIGTTSYYVSAPTNAMAGDSARVVRSIAATGTGAIVVQNLGSGGSTTRTLGSPGMWVDLYFDGTSWIEVGGGTMVTT